MAFYRVLLWAVYFKSPISPMSLGWRMAWSGANFPPMYTAHHPFGSGSHIRWLIDQQLMRAGAIAGSSSSSSSGAFAQVIRVAHSGVRSSCRVDLGFVGFLLIWWFLRRLFLGFLYFLQISFHSWFFHSFFGFWCILGWCVLGFLYSLCRTCTGWYFPDLFCNFLSPLSLMLWLWALHCIVFCSSMSPAITSTAHHWATIRKWLQRAEEGMLFAPK